MKTCPKCKNGSISIEPFLQAGNVVSQGIAGQTVKVVAKYSYRAVCSNTDYCNLNVVGHLEDAEIAPDGTFTGGYFVQD